jgi:hypothetical protein
MIDNVLYQSQGEDVKRLSAAPDTSSSYRIDARQKGVAWDPARTRACVTVDQAFRGPDRLEVPLSIWLRVVAQQRRTKPLAR